MEDQDSFAHASTSSSFSASSSPATTITAAGLSRTPFAPRRDGPSPTTGESTTTRRKRPSIASNSSSIVLSSSPFETRDRGRDEVQQQQQGPPPTERSSTVAVARLPVDTSGVGSELSPPPRPPPATGSRQQGLARSRRSLPPTSKRPRSPPELYSVNPFAEEEESGSVLGQGFSKLLQSVKKTFSTPTASAPAALASPSDAAATPGSSWASAIVDASATEGQSNSGGGGALFSGSQERLDEGMPSSASAHTRVESNATIRSSKASAGGRSTFSVASKTTGGGGGAAGASIISSSTSGGGGGGESGGGGAGGSGLLPVTAVAKGEPVANTSGSAVLVQPGLMGPPPPRTAAQRLAAAHGASLTTSGSSFGGMPRIVSGVATPTSFVMEPAGGVTSSTSSSISSFSAEAMTPSRPRPINTTGGGGGGSSDASIRTTSSRRGAGARLSSSPALATRFTSLGPSGASPFTNVEAVPGTSSGWADLDPHRSRGVNGGSGVGAQSNSLTFPSSNVPQSPIVAGGRHGMAYLVQGGGGQHQYHHHHHHPHFHSGSVSGLPSNGTMTMPDSPLTPHSTSSLSRGDAYDSSASSYPVQDDARSIKSASRQRTDSMAGRRIRRITLNQGLSKDYWMDDASAKACFDCQTVFNTFKRKHHCRVCGQIFCAHCASSILNGARFGRDGMIRVCNLCLHTMQIGDSDDEDDSRSLRSSTASYIPQHPFDGPPDSTAAYTPSGLSRALDAGLGSLSGSVARLARRTSDVGSRPGTPIETLAASLSTNPYALLGQGRPSHLQDSTTDWQERTVSAPAPFRQGIEEEEDGFSMGIERRPSIEHGSPVLGGLNNGSGSQQQHQHPYLLPEDRDSRRTSGVTSLTSSPRFEGRPKLMKLGESTISFPSSQEGEDDLTEALYRPRLTSRFDSNAPLPPSGGLRHRTASRFSLPGLLIEESLGAVGAGTGGAAGVSGGTPGGGGEGGVGGKENGGPLTASLGPGRPRASSLSHPSQTIEGQSMIHFRKLLREAIIREQIPHGRMWAEVLAKHLVRISVSVQSNVKAGDSIDIREYVKIKKIPGGRISDSEYVDGTVITKNWAHKLMPRHLKNPRIMILTFPLDYHRIEGQFMPLDPLVSQERDYLRNLVQRIVAVRPHIVLVEKNVSRLALEGLQKANISVARSVKYSSLQAIARTTQSDSLASIDRLVLEPRLGRCADVRIQTFDHPLIPAQRKTFMRFEGCRKELGCTLLLRGADVMTLRKVKQVADFMVFAIYHLKLEMFLWHDSWGVPPPEPPLVPKVELPLSDLTPFEDPNTVSSPGSLESPETPGVTPTSPKQRHRSHDDRILSKRIYDALIPYVETTLSISTSVRFPPPHPVAKMSQLDLALHDLRHACDVEEAELILREENEINRFTSQPTSPAVESMAMLSFSTLEDLRNPFTLEGDVEVSGAAKAGGSGADGGGHTHTSSDDSEVSLADSVSTVSTITQTAKPRPNRLLQVQKPTALPTLESMLHRPEEVARASALAQTEFEHRAQLWLWEWYLYQYRHTLQPIRMQGIRYLSARGVLEPDHRSCGVPHQEEIVFYQANDMTLGQWIALKANTALQTCPEKGCSRPQLQHYETLCHRETRLQVAMARFADQTEPERIMTWTFCQACPPGSDVGERTFLSDNAWKMSWGKYLEVQFYPNPDRTSLPGGCRHDYVFDNVRFFAYRTVVLRIHVDSIYNYEICLPTTRPFVRAETKVNLKNEEISSCFVKAAVFWDSVAARIRSFDVDVVEPAMMDSLRLTLADLLDRVDEDRRTFIQTLRDVVGKSAVTDVLAINPVWAQLQNKVVEWDESFVELEKTFIPSDNDLRRLTEKKIRRLFANQDVFGSEKGMTTISASVSEVDEKEDDSVLDSSSMDGSVDGSESQDGLSDAGDSVSSDALPCDRQPTFSSFLFEGSSNPPLSFSPAAMEGPPPVVLSSDDGATPSKAGVFPDDDRSEETSYFSHHGPSAHFAEITSPPEDGDSDSTINAVPIGGPVPPSNQDMPCAPPTESSPGELETPFVSKIPRRPRPTESIANLVKRFEDTDEHDDDEGQQVLYASQIRRSRDPQPLSESEQDITPAARPRVRRGRTDGTSNKVSGSGLTKSRMPANSVFSDGERATTAPPHSRIPVSKSRSRTPLEGPTPTGSSTNLLASPVNPDPLLSPPLSPEKQPRILRSKPSGFMSSSSSSSHRPIPFEARKGSSSSITRLSKGKGKASPRPPLGSPLIGAGGSSASPNKRTANGPSATSNRVSTIARHFDRLSREAERDRQKRITMAKGRRARPVAYTRAVVKTLDIRDAVKDESDSSASSEADDEEEYERYEQKQKAQNKARRRSLEAIAEAATRVSFDAAAPAQPLPVRTSAPNIILSSPIDKPPEPALSSSAASSSLLSVSPNRSALRDTIALDLAPFDAKAPLPSVPPTPVHQRETFSTKSMLGQLSESELSTGGPERQSIMKTLSGLWAFRTGDFLPLDYPIPVGTHVFADSRVIIREEEPTSIIAFTLGSKLYMDKLKARQTHSRSASISDPTVTGRSGEGTDWSVVGHHEALEYEDQESQDLHVQFDFETGGGGSVFCRVFFLEQFDQLRAMCGLENNDSAFIESLARSAKFDASGGKSGSVFRMTKDERFLCKEIPRTEMDAFSSFAPAYFQYMTECLRDGRPTTLAKIFGVYKIGYKTANRGTQRMNVLIMENLFYERSECQKYDLKGNTRNRHAPVGGVPGQTLLDANFEESLKTSPLYLREYSKRILKGALVNDTKFLADLNIMDYSLVVGVDQTRSELVLGVIDFIRQYTWDKKLESWVKDNFKGAGEPTIVTPKQYKNRFRSAMNRNFTRIPDRWMLDVDPLGKDDWVD